MHGSIGPRCCASADCVDQPVHELRIVGQHVSTGIGRPAFWDRARYYGEDARLANALEAMEKETQ